MDVIEDKRQKAKGKSQISGTSLLVKAKRLDNGEWVTGYYLKDCFPNSAFARHYIYSGMREVNSKFLHNLIEIDPATICRPTGENDKNGREIWERDILENSYHVRWEVGWDKKRGLWAYRNRKTETCLELWLNLQQDEANDVKLAVIGNTIDHPELLEKSHEHTSD